MKARSRLLLLAAALAVAALPAARAADEAPAAPAAPPANQPAMRPEGRGRMDPARMLERLKTELNLTAEQEAKVKAIFQAQAEKRRAIREDGSLAPEDRHAKMRELTRSSRNQIRALLTPEQQQKFDAMPRRGEGPGGGPPPPAPPPPSTGGSA